MKNIENNIRTIIEDDGQAGIDFFNEVKETPYEQEKADFIKKIGVHTDYDIKGVEKGKDGIWRIYDMTAEEWKKYLKD